MPNGQKNTTFFQAYQKNVLLPVNCQNISITIESRVRAGNGRAHAWIVSAGGLETVTVDILVKQEQRNDYDLLDRGVHRE